MTNSVRTNWVGTGSLAVTTLAWILTEFVFKTHLSGHHLGPIDLHRLLSTVFEAGLVGGCADWWAVTVLFRHPFGIPFPHTRIIPKKKKELSDGVGAMIHTLISKESIERELKNWNLGEKFFDYAERARQAGLFHSLLKENLPPIIDELRRGAILEPANREIIHFLKNDLDYAKITGKVMDFVFKNNLDHKFMEFAVSQLKDILHKHRTFLIDEIWTQIEGTVDQGAWGGARVWALGKISGKEDVNIFLNRVEKSLNDRFSPNGPLYSELRRRFMAFPARIESEKTLQEFINTTTRKIIDEAGLDQIIRQLNSWLADYLENELTRPKIERFSLPIKLLGDIFNKIRATPSAIHQVDVLIKQSVESLMSNNIIIDGIAKIAGKKLEGMSDEQLVDFIERRVGNDLQFIRLNGAIIGGLVGGLIYCIKVLV